MYLKITRRGVSRFIDETDFSKAKNYALQGYELECDDKGEPKKYNKSAFAGKGDKKATSAVSAFKKG